MLIASFMPLRNAFKQRVHHTLSVLPDTHRKKKEHLTRAATAFKVTTLWQNRNVYITTTTITAIAAAAAAAATTTTTRSHR